MKKYIFPILILTLLFSFSSCKKVYTCKCTMTIYDSEENSTNVSTSTSTIKDTKKNAEAACEGNGGTITMGPLTETVTCDLQ